MQKHSCIVSNYKSSRLDSKARVSHYQLSHITGNGAWGMGNLEVLLRQPTCIMCCQYEAQLCYKKYLYLNDLLPTQQAQQVYLQNQLPG